MPNVFKYYRKKKNNQKRTKHPLLPKRRLHKAEQTPPPQHSTAHQLSEPPSPPSHRHHFTGEDKGCGGSREAAESPSAGRDPRRRCQASGRQRAAGSSPTPPIPHPSLLSISRLVLTEGSLEARVPWRALQEDTESTQKINKGQRS